MHESVELLRNLLTPNPPKQRLIKQFEPFVQVMTDPINTYARGNRVKGKTSYDKWGTCIQWPEDAPGPMPHVTDDEKVLPDIENWREYVNVPDLVANASDGWEPTLKLAEEIRADGKLVMAFMGTGIFEQCHYLMGFEDTLVNLIAEPDDMHDLVDTIAEYRFTYAKLLVDNLKPDCILSHDDWGAKNQLFMSPEVWRDYFKEHYRKIYSYMRENDVIVMHHADSFCEPIVEDMAEIGIQIWQGVLPTNDIVSMQEKTQGKMIYMGGIDSRVDRADASVEEIRAETRRACETYAPGGHFIPCLTYGGKDSGFFPDTDSSICAEVDQYNADNGLV